MPLRLRIMTIDLKVATRAWSRFQNQLGDRHNPDRPYLKTGQFKHPMYTAAAPARRRLPFRQSNCERILRALVTQMSDFVWPSNLRVGDEVSSDSCDVTTSMGH